VANALWAGWHFTLTDGYVAKARELLSEVRTVDFRDEETARGVINEWVEGKTKSKIKELIPPGYLPPIATHTEKKQKDFFRRKKHFT